MIGWPESAYAGQRVVCIDQNGWNDFLTGEKSDGPQYKDVVTISKIVVRPFGLAFALSEWGQDHYKADAFRPVQTRDTSAQVEALKRLTLDVHDEVRA